ncbi:MULTISPECIES: NERD domain-containing protein kinase family protein [Pseudidiomarina]|uniref:Nuclease-like protein n=2 Tax=Pseudidiomarina TaxID=2800384 RepID=A0A368UY92_9GAMM|nr:MULTISPECIES: NERD domain-containing protein kinase family protein [Pseudidiomarina]PWW14224.1 nuclease-like protein [Pseudidiomarina maritima]RBP92038.1 nuclease-like protein [Pseudidiomarina tainanensis]RCW33802.1 nuclease-like protein [Pseudidiomarina tainanensis]
MSNFLFKKYEGPRNHGDFVWTHPNNKQSILIDGVSGALPEKAIEVCKHWLNNQPSTQRMLRPELVFGELHELLKQHQTQAVICLASHQTQPTTGAEMIVAHVIGNIRIYQLQRFQKPQSLRKMDRTQPLEALGQEVKPQWSRYELPLTYDRKYLIASDGLSHNRILAGELSIEALEAGVRSTLHNLREDDDWSAILFPIDLQTNEVTDDKLLDVLVGDPSSDRAEQAVHNALARRILEEPSLKGAKVIRNPFFRGARSTREVDTLLVSPLGLFFIEVKGHEGDVELYVDSNNRNSMYLIDNRGLTPKRIVEANPLIKGLEAIRNYQSVLAQVASELIPDARKTVVLCFTSSFGHVKCIDGNGAAHDVPFNHGEAIICNLNTLVDSIKHRAETWAGKRLKPKLTPQQIDAICQRFQPPKDEPIVSASLLPGLTYDESKLLTQESSDYFKVYLGSHYNDDVWAKKYISDSFKRLDYGASQSRIAREIPVLQRLGRHRVPGVPYYYWHYTSGADLVVFLEPGHPLNLLDWVHSKPSRQQRINVIQQVASTLQQISMFEDPQIVLRSVNPKNIRLDDKLNVQLINFELIQSDDIKTLPITARSQFDRVYQAEEVLDATAIANRSADVYSFALVCALIVSGDQPNKAYLRQPRGFRELFKAHRFPESGAELFLNAINPNPKLRPTMQLLHDEVMTWN